MPEKDSDQILENVFVGGYNSVMGESEENEELIDYIQKKRNGLQNPYEIE